jgi:hypothetical protein
METFQLFLLVSILQSFWTNRDRFWFHPEKFWTNPVCFASILLSLELILIIFSLTILSSGLSRIRFCAAQVCTFFIDCQSLRELRITSVIIIAIAQKDVCEGFKCKGLIVFSQGGGKFKKSTTYMLPHPSSPPPHPRLLSLFSPLPSSSPHLRCYWPKQSSAHLQGCSPVMMGDPSVVTDAVSYLMDQSRGKPCQSVGVGRRPAVTRPLPLAPWCP